MHKGFHLDPGNAALFHLSDEPELLFDREPAFLVLEPVPKGLLLNDDVLR
jgi:hypothetical protein